MLHLDETFYNPVKHLLKDGKKVWVLGCRPPALMRPRFLQRRVQTY